MKSSRIRHSAGFSLVELVIVIVIIGVIAAIAVPTVWLRPLAGEPRAGAESHPGPPSLTGSLRRSNLQARASTNGKPSSPAHRTRSTA